MILSFCDKFRRLLNTELETYTVGLLAGGGSEKADEKLRGVRLGLQTALQHLDDLEARARKEEHDD